MDQTIENAEFRASVNKKPLLMFIVKKFYLQIKTEFN